MVRFVLNCILYFSTILNDGGEAVDDDDMYVVIARIRSERA